LLVTSVVHFSSILGERFTAYLRRGS